MLMMNITFAKFYIDIFKEKGGKQVIIVCGLNQREPPKLISYIAEEDSLMSSEMSFETKPFGDNDPFFYMNM